MTPIRRPGYRKYGAIKFEVDGIKFDSKKEARRYSELKLLQIGGEISDLKLQPVFELLPKIRWQGQTLRRRAYIADFMYDHGGETIVEDAKGFKTPEYKLKRHLFLMKYGDKYKFIET